MLFVGGFAVVSGVVWAACVVPTIVFQSVHQWLSGLLNGFKMMVSVAIGGARLLICNRFFTQVTI